MILTNYVKIILFFKKIMKIKGGIKITLILLLLFHIVIVYLLKTASLAEEVYQLQDIKMFQHTDTARFILIFNMPYPDIVIPYIENSKIMIDVPKAYLAEEKKEFSIDDPIFKHISIARLDNNIGIKIGISYREGLEANEKGMGMYRNNNGMILDIDKSVFSGYAINAKNTPTDTKSSSYSQYKRQAILPHAQVGKEDNILYVTVKVFSMLAFVLACIFFILFFLKRYGRKIRLLNSQDIIKVIAHNYIGQKKGITIVDVAGEVLVLGTTPTAISLLTKVDPKKIGELFERQGIDSDSSSKKHIAVYIDYLFKRLTKAKGDDTAKGLHASTLPFGTNGKTKDYTSEKGFKEQLNEFESRYDAKKEDIVDSVVAVVKEKASKIKEIRL